MLEIARLTLRPGSADDLDFLLLLLWNEPLVMRYAGGALNWSGTEILEWFAKYPRPHPAFPDDLFPEEIHFLVRLRNGQRIEELEESDLTRLPAN